jgi:hypothetical protein
MNKATITQEAFIGMDVSEKNLEIYTLTDKEDDWKKSKIQNCPKSVNRFFDRYEDPKKFVFTLLNNYLKPSTSQGSTCNPS